MKKTDKNLLEAIHERDEKAFNEFYIRYSALLYKWAYKRIGDAEIVNDIAQDFWSKLWVNPQIIKTNNDDSAKNFLLHFYTFRILDYFRDVNKKRELIVPENYLNSLADTTSYTHILEDIQEKEVHDLINEILESLPKLTQEIFVCRWKKNYSIKETASYLNIGEKIVYNKTLVALKNIRSKVKKILSDEEINHPKSLKTNYFNEYI